MTTTISNAGLPASSLESLPTPAPNVTAEKPSYSQILKSSALIGGSSVLNIGIRILRTKAMAVLLGPSGYGLAGLYGSVSDLTQNIAGMGVNSSGVRQIAEAVGSCDEERIARTTAVLRKTSVALGLLGAVLLVMFSRQVSALTFGNSEHSVGISLLAIAVFFGSVTGGQSALLQGMRRISDFAQMGVLGALAGAVITIALVYFLRDKGIVPALVGVAAMAAIISYAYSRKVNIRTPVLTLSEVRQEAAALLKLGFAFMSSGLMTMGAAYFTRIVLLRKVGFEATGLYQAAWALGGLYVGFVLQAMGADFYPRLTASASNDPVCNRLVNEQTRIGLLIAGPGLLATLTFAPIVIALFYSTKFVGAVGILRWVCLGTTLQVVSWPMGYIILAKGRRNVFFWSELAWAVVSLGLAWTCITSFGANGAGIAFFGSYVFHGLFMYAIVSRISGFRWSKDNKETGLLLFSFVAIVFCGSYVLPLFLASCIGTLAVLVSGAYSIRVLTKLIPWDEIPQPVRRLLMGIGTVPST
jgi:enterobacterial common antigen flippase